MTHPHNDARDRRAPSHNDFQDDLPSLRAYVAKHLIGQWVVMDKDDLRSSRLPAEPHRGGPPACAVRSHGCSTTAAFCAPSVRRRGADACDRRLFHAAVDGVVLGAEVLRRRPAHQAGLQARAFGRTRPPLDAAADRRPRRAEHGRGGRRRVRRQRREPTWVRAGLGRGRRALRLRW